MGTTNRIWLGVVSWFTLEASFVSHHVDVRGRIYDEATKADSQASTGDRHLNCYYLLAFRIVIF